MYYFLPAWELANGQDPECLGVFFGLIGRIQCPVIEEYILLVKESVCVGELPSGHAIHKIKSVAMFNPANDVRFFIFDQRINHTRVDNFYDLCPVLSRFEFKTVFQTP